MPTFLGHAAWRRIVKGLQEHPAEPDAVLALRTVLLRLSRRHRAVFSEDLVQDVLVRILEHPTLLLKVRSPESYLLLLLRREQFVGLRRAALDTRSRKQAGRERPLMDASVGADAPTQTGLIARIDLKRLLERAGEHLTDEDLQLLKMRFWEGQDLRTIAETLQISYTSTAVRVFRLLSRLRASARGDL